MGALLIDSSTKGFIELTSIALAPVRYGGSKLDNKEISPALEKLLKALKEQGSKGKPTEVLIMINGRKEDAFTIVIDDLSEIQEILQWTVGQA